MGMGDLDKQINNGLFDYKFSGTANYNPMRGAVDAIMGSFYDYSKTDQNFYASLREYIIMAGKADQEGWAEISGMLRNNADYYARSINQGQHNYEEAQRRAAAQRAEMARQQQLAEERAAAAIKEAQANGTFIGPMPLYGPPAPNLNTGIGSFGKLPQSAKMPYESLMKIKVDPNGDWDAEYDRSREDGKGTDKSREREQTNSAWGKRGSREREEASKDLHDAKKGGRNDVNKSYNDLKSGNVWIDPGNSPIVIDGATAVAAGVTVLELILTILNQGAPIDVPGN